MAGLKITNNKGTRRHLLAAGMVVGGALLLGGCTSVPDAVNPAEWYRSTMDFFDGDDKEGQAARKTNGEEEKDSHLKADRGKQPPGADKPFPSLASVPSGLGADRSERKYASVPSRQGDAVNVLSEEPQDKKPAPAQIASAPPPPQAAPAPAVTRAEPQSEPRAAPSSQSSTEATVPVRLRPPPPPGESVPTPSAVAPQAPRLTPPPGNQGGNQVAELPPQQPEPSLSYDPYATVVVSSGGMEMADQVAQAAPTARMPVMPTRSLSELTRAAPPMRQEMQQAPNYAPAFGGGQGLVKVATILFSNGSAALSARDRRILRDVAQLQRESGGRPVVIVGHASSRTRNMSPVRHSNVNYRLSQNRADTVARSLRAMGIPDQAMRIQAAGDTQPIYYEVMPAGEAGNRRADIYISY
ncbi:MAG: OmpA family protein [Rhodospirillales bacterium]